MSEAARRAAHMAELDALWYEIQPTKNEEIARRAIHIARLYITKAENQAKQLRNLENRNRRDET